MPKACQFPTQWVLAALLLCVARPLAAAGYRTENLGLRSRPQTLYIYEPAGGTAARPFQVIVTSGDLGWLGISVDIAERLRDRGYRIIGFNARAYLASFTGKSSHLESADIPGDYKTIMNWATRDTSRPARFMMVGVSEGAGLVVAGFGQGQLDARCHGIVALGLPGNTSLGWRWTDFTTWITKRDPNEPMAETRNFLAGLRVPVALIHSTHDEYDSIDKARSLFALLPGPKEFLAIDAMNHRFSDKVGDVLAAVEKCLLWMERSTGPESVSDPPAVRYTNPS
jgi:pimeloyl-ACP methyl ester carboxylesterase